MGEISGVSTADIDNVDGFFTTQTGGGGSGATANPIATGAQLFGTRRSWQLLLTDSYGTIATIAHI